MSRSTFSVLFYVNRGKEKNGVVPVMGRVTINGTQSQFSCKKSIPLTLWDAKGNCAKGRSKEALQLNRDLDNIKAQIIKHYQHLADREAFVTAEMVRNSYQGFGSEYETLLNAFDKDIASFKKRVGKDRVISTLWAMQLSRKDTASFIESHYRRKDISMLVIDFSRFARRSYATRLARPRTDTRLYQGLRCLSQHGARTGKRHHLATLHVAERSRERPRQTGKRRTPSLLA